MLGYIKGSMVRAAVVYEGGLKGGYITSDLPVQAY